MEPHGPGSVRREGNATGSGQAQLSFRPGGAASVVLPCVPDENSPTGNVCPPEEESSEDTLDSPFSQTSFRTLGYSHTHQHCFLTTSCACIMPPQPMLSAFDIRKN